MRIVALVLLGIILGLLTVVLLPWLFLIVVANVIEDAKDTLTTEYEVTAEGGFRCPAGKQYEWN